MIRAAVFLAVLLIASAVHAQTSPADQLYLQTAGHTASGATIFATELQITNESDDAIDVSITFAPTNATDDDPRYAFAQFLPRRITLAPREYREVRDERLAAMIPTGIGMFILDGCKVGADCSTQYDLVHGLRVEKVPNVRARRPISVTARVYSYVGTAANGTRGEAYPSVPWFDVWSSDGTAAGLDRPFLTGIRNDSHFRTNVSFANASGYSTIALRATLYDGLGQSRGSYDLSLGPLESRLVGAEVMFPALVESRLNRRLIKSPWIRVEQVAVTPNVLAVAQADVALGCADGCPGFLVQASVTDILPTFVMVGGKQVESSHDSWRLDAQPEKDGGLNGQSDLLRVRASQIEALDSEALGVTGNENRRVQSRGLPLPEDSARDTSSPVTRRPYHRITDLRHFAFTGSRCSIEPSADDYLVRTADGKPWVHVGVGELERAREMCGAARSEAAR